MAEPASDLTERLLAAVNRERETRHWTIDEWRLRVGDEWPSESSRPLLELSACATEAAGALEQAEHDVIGLSTSVARLEAALEQAERDKASLRLEIEAWKHNGKKDNEYLLGKLEQAEKALRRLASQESFTVAFDTAHAPADVIWRELQARGRYAVEALAAPGGQDKQETT